METSLNSKGDLEKGLLDSRTSQSNGTPSCPYSEAEKGAIVSATIALVLLASLGFLIYLGVVVSDMHSDVASLKAHDDNIDKINAAISNLQYEIGSIRAAINGLDLQVQNICLHISC